MASSSDISDCLTACNPIRTLAFLVREMKEVAKDQRFVIILGEMEKTLPRIAADVDVVSLQAKLADLQAEVVSLQAELSALKENQLDEILAKVSAASPAARKLTNDDDTDDE